MKKIWLTLAVLLWGSVALAQGYLSPIVPQPYNAVPLGPTGAGVVGTGNEYVPWNAQQRQAVQRAVALTDASGNFSITWATSFVSSTPTVTVTAGNPAGTQPIVCNWQTRSATGVTGKCWLSNTTLLNLSIVTTGLTLNNFLNPPAANTPISVIMAEPTQ